jgi:hypothetical protein
MDIIAARLNTTLARVAKKRSFVGAPYWRHRFRATWPPAHASQLDRLGTRRTGWPECENGVASVRRKGSKEGGGGWRMVKEQSVALTLAPSRILGS